MARRVFFSFHYQDVIDFRANVVRQHWVTKLNRDQAGFFDASVWEKAQRDSELALKRLINGAIKGTSRTAVLIGSETARRRWVRYEIFRSVWAGSVVVGVHINGIKGRNQRTKASGASPFDVLGLYHSEDGTKATPCYREGRQWYVFDDCDEYDLKTRAQPERRGSTVSLAELGCNTYDWVRDDGYQNFASWVA